MEEQLTSMYLSDDAVPLTSNCGIPGCLIGWLVGVEETGFPLVDYQDNTKGPLPARYTMSPGSGGWKAAWSPAISTVSTCFPWIMSRDSRPGWLVKAIRGVRTYHSALNPGTSDAVRAKKRCQ